MNCKLEFCNVFSSQFNDCILSRTAAGYGLDDGGVGVRVPVGSRPALRPSQPTIQWVLGGAVSPGVKRLEREAVRSSASGVEVKNYGALPPLPLTHSWCSA
jgi:hypothetical protein